MRKIVLILIFIVAMSFILIYNYFYPYRNYYDNKDDSKKISKISNENLVLYFNGTSVEKIYHIVNNESSMSINSTLINEPGIYKWGAEYNMTREGYYYLVDFNSNINKNLIIYKHNIFSLLLSLSWLHVHGTKDRLLSHEERIKKIANNKLSLTCGDISLFIQRLLQQKGIESRIASFLTMEQWNTYDNVHTLLEVKVDEKWTLFDIDNNRYFMYKNKEMNLRDFFEDINWDDIKFVFLSSDENLDTQSFSSDGINYYGVADFIYSDIKTWYKRVLQILIILENEKIYIALKDTQYKDRVLAYYPNALIMTIDEFNKRFYGEKNEEEYPNYKNHF